jgi:hypothetical protein
VRSDPRLYAWFLHDGLADALMGRSEGRLRTKVRRIRTRHDANAWAYELEQWLRVHEVPSLEEAWLRGAARPGALVWAELPFRWSDVVRERAHASDGADVRSSFAGQMEVGEGAEVLVHGSFNPARLTCSTANSELRGVRTQYVLGHVAAADDESVELRPVAIASRLLEPPGRHPEDGEWQRVFPEDIDQFREVDWAATVATGELDALRRVPEREVKRILAELLGEPTVPKDWGGETCDLYTDRLRVRGRPCSAAFLLKGPARFEPMTVRLLGANGDQLVRLATTPAQLLVVQHCHSIRPEVISLLRSLASDMRHVRRYMVLDGYDTYRLLSAFGAIPD